MAADDLDPKFTNEEPESSYPKQSFRFVPKPHSIGSSAIEAARIATARHSAFPGWPHLTTESLLVEELGDLKRTIAEQEEVLSRTARELAVALKENSTTETDKNTLIHKYEAQLEALQRQRDLRYLIGRVSSEAGEKLLKDAEFVQKFESAQTCNAFVLSVDIRRSTDLMLNGRTPELYAGFINELCVELSNVVKTNFGVLDKFTGDGLLSYFPDFYSGSDAGLRALSTAQQCHEVFARRYRMSRKHFNLVLKDVGLGIGIDFGEVHLRRVTDELTVIGRPVVFACRLGGAPAGSTYLNQNAMDELEAHCPGRFLSKEVEFDIKNEGPIHCYAVSFAGQAPTNLLAPEWMTASSSSPSATAMPSSKR